MSRKYKPSAVFVAIVVVCAILSQIGFWLAIPLFLTRDELRELLRTW